MECRLTIVVQVYSSERADSWPKSWLELALQLPGKTLAISDLTFPNDRNPPTHLFKLPLYPLIAFQVIHEFVLPKQYVGLWSIAILALFVSMPEATMNKDHGLESGEH